MPVVMDLLEYWSENPPTHVIQAAKAGLGKRRRRERRPEEELPYREQTPEEKRKEKSLPEWARKLRQEKREQRKANARRV